MERPITAPTLNNIALTVADRHAKASARHSLSPRFAGILKPAQKLPPLGPSKYANIPATFAKQHPAVSPIKPARTHAARPAKQPIHFQKRTTDPEHALLTSFQQASESYKTHTTTHIETFLQSTIDTLTTSLKDATLSSQSLLDEAKRADRGLTIPFKDEGLVVRDPVTKEKVRTTVEERVKEFKKLYKEEWEALRRLWGRWGGVVTAVQAVDLDDAGDANATGGVGKGQSFTSRYQQLESQYAARRAAILQKYEEKSGKLLDSVKAGEKKFAAQRKEQQKQFLRFLEMQMQEDDGGEEGEDYYSAEGGE